MKHGAENLVLWSDEALLAINKPAGLPTLPDGYDLSAPYVRNLLEPEYGRLWIVHRLDKDTSGVLVLARSAQAHRSLNMQFDAHQAHKVYHALVVGSPAWEETSVEMPLRPDGDRRHRTVVDPERGKPALTELRLLERFGDHSLVEASPRTGRTHQIRAHLAALGFPLAGDMLYGENRGIFPTELEPGYQRGGAGGRAEGKAGERALIQRPALHAWSLEVRHPLRDEPLRFEAPYPEDFAAALRQLRKHP
jgi:RluA family pseudouridine synthase